MNLSARLNDVTNIVILGVILWIGVEFAKVYRRDIAFYKAGDIVRGIPPAALRGSPLTLLLQVNSECAACDVALPFYRRLVSGVREEKAPVRIVALTAQESAPCDEYLRENSIIVDQVIQLSAESVDSRLTMTPTLILVDSTSTVIGAWPGRVRDVAAQMQIARALGLQTVAREVPR